MNLSRYKVVLLVAIGRICLLVNQNEAIRATRLKDPRYYMYLLTLSSIYWQLPMVPKVEPWTHALSNKYHRIYPADFLSDMKTFLMKFQTECNMFECLIFSIKYFKLDYHRPVSWEYLRKLIVSHTLLIHCFVNWGLC